MLSQHAPLRPSALQAAFFDSNQAPFAVRRNSYSFSDLHSSRSSSIRSTPASSLSLDTKSEDELSSSDDDGLAFPAYWAAEKPKNISSDSPPSSPLPATDIQPPTPPPASTPDHVPVSGDDTNLRPVPSQHVDYLSHDWKEKDIWSSWWHIVKHRSVYRERSRLENALWRQWTKSQFGLRTVTPNSLNWLKENDVTWLYGPLQTSTNHTVNRHISEPTSRLPTSNSFRKKPILKKRSMSEVMLQKSISASSLVSQAAAVQAQQANSVSFEGGRCRPFVDRATASYFAVIPTRTVSQDTTDDFSSQSTSGLMTPDHGEGKHIRFDEKVTQCISVECGGVDEDHEEDLNHNPWAKYRDDDSSSDKGVVMMKRSRRKRPFSRTNSTTSISGENETIAKLPPTTLKYRTESPDVTEQQPRLGFFRSSRLSPSRLPPSPSQESLRPSRPSSYPLPEDDDEEDVTFNPAGAYEVEKASTPTPSDPYSIHPDDLLIEGSDSSVLSRTASGKFMPLEDEDENPQQPGIIGRVVDTVNTARDIAHVIWSVGRRSGN
ncbi:hex2 protein [Paraphaeosphaeria sporulosa]